jgi:hypothetical protein
MQKTIAREPLYERYGFRAFASEPRRLFLPLETFEKLGFPAFP